MNNTVEIKRFEIVIRKDKLSKIVSLLSKTEVRGYTVIKQAGGLGSSGAVDPGDVILNEENVIVILACQEEKAQKLLTEIQPIMKDLGGMCLISDCLWLGSPTGSF
ncbi:P-II family nitrogen regulator [Nitrosomonas aestuarii]|uniref:P-II family nitrogen regulator n=1 Tax=Nitrosomonas aestuarii TaxID=52441 RepID=UPI000D302940|nr:transcriptional regulator [Nitrosomonas aestuarii]PTN13332.1 nitrogen regulatory protein P-II family [Nitrosomonas aestuarii]